MKAVVKKKKLLFSKRHMKERLDFALAHQYWTLDDWRRVIWSDETKINCLGSDGRKWAWTKTGEGLNERLVQGTVKFGGGSVTVWGCFMWEGVGYATVPSGILELWERIEKEWEDIPASECQKLIKSMPRRIEAVIKAKGGYTKY